MLKVGASARLVRRQKSLNDPISKFVCSTASSGRGSAMRGALVVVAHDLRGGLRLRCAFALPSQVTT